MDAGRLRSFKTTTYWKETYHVILQCIKAAEKKGLKLHQFAEVCDLSPATLRKNADGDVGLPQQLTLWKLCAGANFKLEMLGRPTRNGLQIDTEMASIRKALRRKIKPKKQRGRKRKGRKV